MNLAFHWPSYITLHLPASCWTARPWSPGPPQDPCDGVSSCVSSSSYITSKIPPDPVRITRVITALIPLSVHVDGFWLSYLVDRARFLLLFLFFVFLNYHLCHYYLFISVSQAICIQIILFVIICLWVLTYLFGFGYFCGNYGLGFIYLLVLLLSWDFILARKCINCTVSLSVSSNLHLISSLAFRNALEFYERTESSRFFS